MGRISPGPTSWLPGAEQRLVPEKSNLKPQTSFICKFDITESDRCKVWVHAQVILIDSVQTEQAVYTIDSGHTRQWTVKCGRVRQKGDRVATGERQESGRQAARKRQEATGRRQEGNGGVGTGGRSGGNRVAAGRRQGSNRKQDIATGFATGKRREDDRRANRDREATGKRQDKATGERQESDRRATGEQ